MWEEGTSGSKELQFLILVAPAAQPMRIPGGHIRWAPTQPHAESMHSLNELVLTRTLPALGFAWSGLLMPDSLGASAPPQRRVSYLPTTALVGHPSEIICHTGAQPHPLQGGLNPASGWGKPFQACHPSGVLSQPWTTL